MTEINPSYYQSSSFEVIDVIEAFNLNFNTGNVIKYITRAGKKDGEGKLTALLKAQWYLEREIIRVSNVKDARERKEIHNDDEQ